jgi:mono/diheme cytochrome c family protein
MMRCVFLSIILAASVAATSPKPRMAVKLPKGSGKELVQTRCAACHAVTVAVSKRQNADQWGTMVDQMIDRGAKISDAEYDVLVAYLAKNFSAKK